MAPHIPVISIIIRKEDTLLVIIFNVLYSSTNHQLFEKNHCNQSSHYEYYRRFQLWMDAIMYHHKIDTFCIEQR